MKKLVLLFVFLFGFIEAAENLQFDLPNFTSPSSNASNNQEFVKKVVLLFVAMVGGNVLALMTLHDSYKEWSSKKRTTVRAKARYCLKTLFAFAPPLLAYCCARLVIENRALVKKLEPKSH